MAQWLWKKLQKINYLSMEKLIHLLVISKGNLSFVIQIWRELWIINTCTSALKTLNIHSIASSHPPFIEVFRCHYFACFLKIAIDLYVLYECDDVKGYEFIFARWYCFEDRKNNCWLLKLVLQRLMVSQAFWHPLSRSAMLSLICYLNSTQTWDWKNMS